ncbi:MAG: FAD-dependent oxidoreductase [Solirubrobacteraceae bacterium]
MSEVVGLGVQEPEDTNGAFPRLGNSQRERLRAAGRLRPVQAGEILFREGDDDYDFFVVESGAVAIVRGYGGENLVIAVHGHHRFLGELNLLTGERVYLTAVVRDPGEVIQVPRRRLLELLRVDEELANIVFGAFMSRRTILIERGAGVRLIGSHFSEDSRRLREFLARNRMPFQWQDVESDAEAEAVLQALSITPCETPVVIGADTVLRNPSNQELGAMLGIGARGAPPLMCDLVIVGGGPAGLAAAVYGASEGLDTQAIDAVAFGGQASTSSRIENYLGFPAGLSGSELAERAHVQAAKFGARLAVPARATALERDDGHYTIQLSNGDAVNGRTVIIATGAQYRRLDVPDLQRFEGNGVYYAATQSEAKLCFGDPVVVVGGGNSAGQAALFMSKNAASCQLMIRGDDLARSMSRYLIDELDSRPQVELVTNRQVVELKGDDGLEAIVVADSRTGERAELEAKALFVFIGAEPHTDWLRGFVAMDEHCFLLTGRELEGDQLAAYDGERPLFLETSQPGVFAVGDVHSGSIKRVASAVGEGSMAVQLVHQRLAALSG